MNKRRIILSIMIAIFFLICVFITISVSLSYNPIGITSKLTDQWDVTYNEDSYTDLEFDKISDLNKTDFIKKDVITLTTRLPEIDASFPCLSFRSSYCAFELHLIDPSDGTSRYLYSYGMKNYQKSKFVGCDTHFMDIPADYTNYELQITIYVNSTTKELPITTPVFSSNHNITTDFINSHVFSLCVGIFATIFGLSFFFIAIMFVFISRSAGVQILSSLLCIDLGIWILSYYDLLGLFYKTNNMTLISYISMILILPLSYLIINKIHDPENKLVFRIVSFINIFIPVELVLLHFSNTTYLNETRAIYFVTAVFTLAIVTTYLIQDVKNMRKNRSSRSASNMLQLYGLFILGLCMLVEIILTLASRPDNWIANLLYNIALPLGIVIYIATIIFNYIVYSTEGVARTQQYNKLKELAYVDTLTKLPNRAVSDYFMAKYNYNSNDYCIVSIDINGLKEVNDNFGHSEGDKFIKAFANYLFECFEDIGTCTRVGGDEFLIFIDDIGLEQLNKRLDNLKRLFSSLDIATEGKYRHAFAYGYAFKHDLTNPNPHNVYMLADKRMYDLKRKQHLLKK